MLRDMGHDPSMSEASKLSHENLSKLGLEKEIGADDIIDYKELVPMILKRLDIAGHPQE
jgi:hypothetical protein